MKNCIKSGGTGTVYVTHIHTPEFSRFLPVSFDKESSYEYLAERERGEEEELAKYIPGK